MESSGLHHIPAGTTTTTTSTSTTTTTTTTTISGEPALGRGGLFWGTAGGEVDPKNPSIPMFVYFAKFRWLCVRLWECDKTAFHTVVTSETLAAGRYIIYPYSLFVLKWHPIIL